MLNISPIKTAIIASSIWVTVLLSGCASLQLDERNPHINTKATAAIADVPRASYPSSLGCNAALENDACAHPMFVGVAISGGGSRAANFGLGVIAQLRKLGLFDEVTALSSVSGGSLAAAAISLKPLESDADFNLLSTQLRKDYLTSWVYRSANPLNFVPTLTSGKNATRTLADVFDAGIFKGAVFGDLGPGRPGRPSLYINSSHAHRFLGAATLTTKGLNSSEASLQGFTFTDAAFREIGSDLNQLRVADAVAASAAYPGLFVPLALKNFNADTDSYSLPNPKFLHLYDAGSSDNLGVDALVRAYSETLAGTQNSSCLLILVDAHVNDRGDQGGSLADTRSSMIDYVISPSLYQAFDSLLEQRREAQLDLFGVSLASDRPDRFNPNVNIPLKNYAISGVGDSAGDNPGLAGGEATSSTGKAINNANCAVWHIGLDRLLDLTKKGSSRKRKAVFQKAGSDEYRDDTHRDNQLIKLDRFVNSIQTNYKLALNGPGRCDEVPIQNSLFEAARMLTTTDFDSTARLATWLKEHHRERLSQNLAGLLDSGTGTADAGIAQVPLYFVHEPNSSYPLASWINCSK
ncbi:patatin-like phospholipase family protein [Undibacterium sp. TJN19]|uniref:patatin-like phospholipase family protein n=1 Tax=Undibacterium sp. TJN19 TaxID=3413055 RepID=UPI003BEFC12B